MIPRLLTDRCALFEGDSINLRSILRPDAVDAWVSDPPCGIGFMSMEWDKSKGGRDQWINWLADIARGVLVTLKPGAHGLVWGLPRTSHWTGYALEDAGFEVRGRVSHLFGTGMPKSLDMARQIDMHLCTLPGRHCDKHLPKKPREGDHLCPPHPSREAGAGYGTGLKEGLEDWWLVRKPLSEGSVVANMLRWGTGALWIDGCRVGEEGGTRSLPGAEPNYLNEVYGAGMGGLDTDPDAVLGRWPANAVIDEEVAAALGACADFFYVPKPSKSEKDVGLDHLPVQSATVVTGREEGSEGSRHGRAGKTASGRNIHPTVKSVALMRYLVRLIKPPIQLVPRPLVVDTFNGSGTTGIGALAEGCDYLGIEGHAPYVPIAVGRLQHAMVKYPAPLGRQAA